VQFGAGLSRSYYHIDCGGTTVVSEDDYIALESPFRGVDSTMCCSCNEFVTLDKVYWVDSGETIAAYRKRLYESVPAGQRWWKMLFCGGYEGALALNLDKHGRPAEPDDAMQSPDLSLFKPPPEVVALGKPQQTFQVDGWNDPWSPTSVWAANITGVVCILFAAVMLFGSTQVKADSPGRMVALVMGGIFIVMGLGVIFLRFMFERNALVPCALYRDALAFGRDESWTIVRWDEVAEFRGPYPGHMDAVLTMRGGRKVSLPRMVVDPDGLCREVERRTAALVLKQAQASVDSGMTVTFGAFGVSQSGLTYRGQSIGWEEITALAIAPLARPEGGHVGGVRGLGMHLQIGKDGHTWCTEPFLPIPNRTVFLRLLAKLHPPEVEMIVERATGLYDPARL